MLEEVCHSLGVGFEFSNTQSRPGVSDYLLLLLAMYVTSCLSGNLNPYLGDCVRKALKKIKKE